MRKSLMVAILMTCCATASATLMPSMEAGGRVLSSTSLPPIAALRTAGEAPRHEAAVSAAASAEPAAHAPKAADGRQKAGLPLPLPEPGIAIVFLAGVLLLVVSLRQRARRLSGGRSDRIQR